MQACSLLALAIRWLTKQIICFNNSISLQQKHTVTFQQQHKFYQWFKFKSKSVNLGFFFNNALTFNSKNLLVVNNTIMNNNRMPKQQQHYFSTKTECLPF